MPRTKKKILCKRQERRKLVLKGTRMCVGTLDEWEGERCVTQRRNAIRAQILRIQRMGQEEDIKYVLRTSEPLEKASQPQICEIYGEHSYELDIAEDNKRTISFFKT